MAETPGKVPAGIWFVRWSETNNLAILLCQRQTVGFEELFAFTAQTTSLQA